MIRTQMRSEKEAEVVSEEGPCILMKDSKSYFFMQKNGGYWWIIER